MAMTFTYDDGHDRKSQHGMIRKITATWTSDGSGDAAATTDKIVGYLLKGVTIPSGAAAPTDNYDITITDSDSLNVLGNCADDLIDRDTANTEEVHFLISDGTAGISSHPPVCSPLTVTVANAGDTKAGTIVLYYEVR